MWSVVFIAATFYAIGFALVSYSMREVHRRDRRANWSWVLCFFLALILSVLSNYRSVHIGALAVELDRDCFQKLLEEKRKFEKENPGIIVELAFGACEPHLQT